MATLAGQVIEGGRAGGHDPEGGAVPVEKYYGLARALARRFGGRGESLEDLQQVAMLALIKAAGRYNPEHSAAFASYATSCILGELKRHFRDRTWMMRVPRPVQERFLAVKAARDELTQSLGCSPTVAQIADHLHIREEDVLDAMEAGVNYWPLSLDSSPDDDGEGTIEIGVTDDNFDRRLDLRQLQESLSELKPEEQLLIRRIYFEGLTQRTVAQHLGVSQMQVSRLVTRALLKLRHSMEAA